MRKYIFKIQPYLLKNEIQHYAWGQKNECAFIPKLLGIKPERDLPYAELWIGAHPKVPSKIMNTNLLELINEFPHEILGDEMSVKFRGKLPFLMKVLTAGEALSIQAHPNKAQAKMLHAKDPEHYPDDNHKPEIAIALDDFIALVGFKTIPKILKVLENYPPIAEFVPLKILENEDEKALLKRFYTNIKIKAKSDTFELESVLKKMDKLIAIKPEKSEADELYIELHKKYGTDVGLFSIYLLNLVHLKQGEAIFLNAGTPHTYLKGNIIECMANSDNVVRSGLTPKFKDIPILVDILTYETGIPEIMKPDDNSSSTEYKVPVPDFSIIMKKMNFGQEVRVLDDKLEIFILTEGKIQINSDGFTEIFKKGDTILIPAALEDYTISALENTTIYSAIIPEN